MRKDIDMLHGPLLPNLIRFTIPVILSGWLQLLFNAADLAVVGQFCGSVSVAGVGSTGSITNLLVNFFVGISVGAGVCVAQALGAHRDQEVHDTVHTAMPLAVISGLLLTVVGICMAEKMLIMMDTPDNVLPLSVLYMRIIFSGVTFNIVYNFGAAILRAAGDTKGPLLYLTAAGVINVILNVIFVTLFDMNVAGVALATIISQAISAALVVRALMRREDACRLELREMRIRKAPLGKMVYIGLPAGLQSCLFSISNVVIQSSVNSFGDTLMSANAACISIEGFIFTVDLSFQQATVTFVGQNAGAKQYRRCRQILRICIACSSLSTLLLSGVVYFMGPTLLSIYITDSAQALEYGVMRFGIVAINYWICCTMDICTGALRGLGKSIVPMIVAVVGICGFRILWIYTLFQLPALHTPEFLYLSFPVSWFITGVCQLGAFHLVYRQLPKEGQSG